MVDRPLLANLAAAVFPSLPSSPTLLGTLPRCLPTSQHMPRTLSPPFRPLPSMHGTGFPLHSTTPVIRTPPPSPTPTGDPFSPSSGDADPPLPPPPPPGSLDAPSEGREGEGRGGAHRIDDVQVVSNRATTRHFACEGRRERAT